MTPAERAEYEPRFRSHWLRFLRRFAIVDDSLPTVYGFLMDLYGAESRHYHTMKHIVRMLDELEALRHTVPESLPGLFNDPIEDAAIEFGVWFHDAVYDTMEHDNEERSAQYAKKEARRLGLSRPVAQLTKHYIRTTDHRRLAEDRGAEILCDLDLMSLAGSRDEFRENTRLIQLEYAHVPNDKFKAGRRAFFEAMLDRNKRPSIYQTAYFFDRFEEKARANLRHAVRCDLAP